MPGLLNFWTIWKVCDRQFVNSRPSIWPTMLKLDQFDLSSVISRKKSLQWCDGPLYLQNAPTKSGQSPERTNRSSVLSSINYYRKKYSGDAIENSRSMVNYELIEAPEDQWWKKWELSCITGLKNYTICFKTCSFTMAPNELLLSWS